MGMFDKRKSSGNYNKCECPHCRGGHGFHQSVDEFYTNGSDFDYTNEEISVHDLERVDPEELVEEYIGIILECETPEDVEAIMREFFDEIFIYAVKETYINEVEAKIMQLNMINERFDELEDDE